MSSTNQWLLTGWTVQSSFPRHADTGLKSAAKTTWHWLRTWCTVRCSEQKWPKHRPHNRPRHAALGHPDCWQNLFL